MLDAKQIRTMPAGPEFDALVAERVMGWRWTIGDSSHKGQVIVWPEPDRSGIEFAPSTNIAAAWIVLASVCQPWRIEQDPCGWSRVTISRAQMDGDDWDHFSVACENNQIPLGICRAALLATPKTSGMEPPVTPASRSRRPEPGGRP